MLQRYWALGLMVFCVSAFAADVTPAEPVVTTAAAAPLKIGVVDVRTAIQKSSQLNAINTQLAKGFKPRETKIVDAQAALKVDEDKLQKNGASMSDTDRGALRDKIITERANLQAMITSFQQDLDSAQNSAMQKLLVQIAGIVNDIAKAQKFDVILQGDNVPFVVDRLNITNEVLDQLNKK